MAFVALVPLLLALESMDAKQAFRAGLTMGLVHFTTLIYWLVPTLTTYGNLAWGLAAATLVLLSLYLALYPALFALALKKLDPPAWAHPLAAAALWTGLEYLRTHLLTGFGWGALGYSQETNLTWLQSADLFGVSGLTFVIVLCNAALARLLLWRPGHAMPPLGMALAYTLALCAGIQIYGSQRMTTLSRTLEIAPTTRVAVVQGNLEQNQKWNKAFKTLTLDKYRRLSLSVAGQIPDLTIWPETALPFYYGRDALLSLEVERTARQIQSHLLTGSPAVAVEPNLVRYYNRAHMISPTGMVTGRYDKTHLVPFGEYVPLQEFLPFIRKITQEAGNYTPGEKRFSPLAFGQGRTGVLICFEILFPGISRAFVNQGAQILTTMTNDAWFGTTAAPVQHFGVAVFRAVENRRSLARAANTGISGFIDPLGRPRNTTALFADAAVTADLPILSETSFYTAQGDRLPTACLIAMALCFMVKGRQTILRRHQP